MTCATANAAMKKAGTRAMEIHARANGLRVRGPCPSAALLDELVVCVVLAMMNASPVPALLAVQGLRRGEGPCNRRSGATRVGPVTAVNSPRAEPGPRRGSRGGALGDQ